MLLAENTLFLRMNDIRCEAEFGFIRKIEGALVLLANENDAEQVVGSFAATAYDIENAISHANSYGSVYDIFDVTRDLSDMSHVLYTSKLEVRANIRKVAQRHIFNRNFITIDLIKVYEAHRGNNIGLQAIRGIVDFLRPGMSIVFIQPYPLQFSLHEDFALATEEEKLLNFGAFKYSHEESLRKLRYHYGKLGFNLLPKKNLMVMSTNVEIPDFSFL
jgi:hypothetical protein